MMKRILVFAAFFLILLISACFSKDQTGVLDTETKSIDQWEVTILKREITNDLSATQSVVQYGGDTQDIAFNEKPQEGNVFVLIKLDIEKTETGQSKFVWANAQLVDADGNRYSRHENDTFLANFNLARIKSTDLVFGNHTGFVCYEIPQEAANGKLFFVYKGMDGGQIEIRVN